MCIRNDVPGKTLLLQEIPKLAHRRCQLGLAKEIYNLRSKILWILVCPQSAFPILDQFPARGRRPANDRLTIRPGFYVGDAERLMIGRKAEDLAGREGVRFRALASEPKIPEGIARQISSVTEAGIPWSAQEKTSLGKRQQNKRPRLKQGEIPFSFVPPTKKKVRRDDLAIPARA